jgi:hypothetical protein
VTTLYLLILLICISTTYQACFGGHPDGVLDIAFGETCDDNNTNNTDG